MLSISEYWKNSLNQKNPTKFIISKILIRLKISKYFTINQDGYKLRFFPSALSRLLWIDPNEPHTASIFFPDYLKKGDTVIDVGSNIGTVTLQCSVKIGSSGKVYSIEPNPKIFNFLLDNIRFNNKDNIKTFNTALGDSDGEIYFSDKISDVVNSIIENDSGVRVKITTLGKLLTKDDVIHLLKIDVQGYDKFVFLGSKNILKKTECVHFPVIREHYQNFGYDYEEIFELLKNSGFELYGFSRDRKIWKLDQDYVPNNEDLLAIRNIDDFISRTGYTLNDNI